jgi:pimeloyl-ACP methyl ester carboxylesterase
MSSTATSADDPARVAAYAQPIRLDRGSAPWCVVLFHGLTNNPNQFRAFAERLHANGSNVLVPRMPYHGYADRMTKALAQLTAEGLIGAANAAVDEARMLGERVAVLGISMGGLLCAHIAQFRADVAVSVPVAPDFGLLRFPRDVTALLSRLLLKVPNLFLWWDPRVRGRMLPDTAYPRFATHALMQTLRVGNIVYDAAARERAAAGRICVVVNPRDPAVNNAAAYATVERWRKIREVEYVELPGLKANHDIIDPGNPEQQIDVVYPKLLGILNL